MVAKHPITRANAKEFGQLLQEKVNALGISRAHALKHIAEITGGSYESARKYWEGEMTPRHWRLEKIAEWLQIHASDLIPMNTSPKAESPGAAYDVQIKKQECLRLFTQLPSGLQDHMLVKMNDLLWYLDQLPPFLRTNFKPPTERYGEWERDVEADMRRLKQSKNREGDSSQNG